MLRSAPLSILVLGAVAVSAAAPAQGASIRFQRSCYIFEEGMSGKATGFLPNSKLTINSSKEWLPHLPMRADRSGTVALPLVAPDLPAKWHKMSVLRRTITLWDPHHRSRRAHTTLSFSSVLADPGRQRDPRARRTWHFIGIRGRGALYGHYVFRGRLMHTHRFGVPKGPCGRLVVRAAGFPIPKSKLRVGGWSVQFDRNPNYNPSGPDILTKQMTLPQGYSTGK